MTGRYHTLGGGHARLMLALVCSSVPLGGCASSVTAWKARPIAAHNLHMGRMWSMTGERRLAFMVPRQHAGQPPSVASYSPLPKPDRDEYVQTAWCAESLPEAAQAVSATSKPALDTGGTKLGADEAFSTTLVQTFARTEIAEVLRQTSWNACQGWLQGVYTDSEYKAELSAIRAAALQAIQLRAQQPLVAPAPQPKADEKKPQDKAG